MIYAKQQAKYAYDDFDLYYRINVHEVERSLHIRFIDCHVRYS